MHFNYYWQSVNYLAQMVWGTKTETGNDLVARLCEEAGELAQAIRKYEEGVRFGHDESPGTKEAIYDELQDLLFMTARIAIAYGFNLNDVAKESLRKIYRRIEKNGKADL